MFQNLQIMWNDPVGRKRIYFFVGVGLGLILLILAIIQLNFGGSRNTTNDITNITGDVGFKKEVTSKSFDSNATLTKIESVNLGSDEVAFAANNQPIVLNSSLKLRVKGEDVPNSPSFISPSIINSSEGIVINEPKRTTILSVDNKFKKLDTNIYGLTQYFAPNSVGVPSISKWAFINYSGGLYTVSVSDTIGLNTDKVIATISPNITAARAELVVFNQQIYFIAWQNINRTGDMEVWFVKEKTSPQRVYSKSQVQSIIYGPDSLLVTTFSNKPTELTFYQNTWLDFKLNPSGNPTDLQTDFNLSQAKVFGSLLAERCSIGNDATAYCLIKEGKVPSTSYVSKDAIMKVNLRLSSVNKIKDGLSLSGSSIHQDGSGNLYVVSQEDKFLYQVKI